jgi:hypothetical protein
MGGLQVLLERRDRAETTSAQNAFGQVSNGVVLRVRLQFLQRFERQTALVASVFVNVFFGHENILLSGMNFAEVNVQVLNRGEVKIAALLPAQVSRSVGRLFDFHVTGVVLMLAQVVNILAHFLTSRASVFVDILLLDFVGFLVRFVQIR